MKKLLPLIYLACIFTMVAPPCAGAQDEAPAKSAKGAKKKAGKKAFSPELKKALGKLPYISPKRLNTKAEFFIYLQSGSQCRNCNYEMPGVVKEYKDMKESGAAVDILLICHDDKPETALEFMKKYGADFPVVLRKDVSPETLPGFESARGIPYWQIVRTDTAEATKGRGPALENWRLKTVDKPAVPARPRPPQPKAS